MSKVIAGFSMSLDGFVADPDDGVDQVFKWYSAAARTMRPWSATARSKCRGKAPGSSPSWCRRSTRRAAQAPNPGHCTGPLAGLSDIDAGRPYDPAGGIDYPSPGA